MTTRLYVGNLPSGMTEYKLQALFSRLGKVDSVTIPPNPEGKENHFAYVDMDSEKDAEEVLNNLQGQEIEGRELMLNRVTTGISDPESLA